MQRQREKLLHYKGRDMNGSLVELITALGSSGRYRCQHQMEQVLWHRTLPYTIGGIPGEIFRWLSRLATHGSSTTSKHN